MFEFKDYWQGLSKDAKISLATRLHTSVAYMSQVAHNHRRPSKRLVDLVEIVTGEKFIFSNCCED